MKSRAVGSFWEEFQKLPPDVQILSQKQYRLWLANHSHPSVQFKKVKKYWSARVTDDYRALGILAGDTVVWFWIGSHVTYERLLKK